jgi:tRNA G10  N-methylase Trm11
MKPLRVIGWDMKAVLVADERVVRVYRVPWKDVHLVESERVMQVPIVQSVDHSKFVDRRKEKKPFFRAGKKLGGS